jgi:OOP family OmpA-OmpF porin
MRTTLLATITGAALLAASASAWSQAPGRFYAGAAIGQSKMKDACASDADIAVSNCDDKDTAWKIFAGYQFTPNLALEAAYNDFGRTRADVFFVDGGFQVSGHETFDVTALELSAVASLPFANRFAGYGRLGLYHGEIEGKGDFTDQFGTRLRASVSDSNVGLTFGLGASYDLTERVRFRVEWQRFHDVGTNDIGKSDVDVLSVAGLYRF